MALGGTTALRLRFGVSASRASDELERLASEAVNLANRGGGITVEQYRDEYLRWVFVAEDYLRGLFLPPGPHVGLFSERYWQLYRIDATTPEPWRLISAEAKAQSERLGVAASSLRDLCHMLDLRDDACAVVVDTGVFLHFQPFGDLPWAKLTKSKIVRLVVPLIVIDELDDLSYRGRPTADRAKKVLRDLRGALGDGSRSEHVALKEGLELQTLLDPVGHERRANADDEILLRSELVAALTAQPVFVASGDYGMQLRAAARGLRFVAIPEKYRLPLVTP